MVSVEIGAKSRLGYEIGELGVSKNFGVSTFTGEGGSLMGFHGVAEVCVCVREQFCGAVSGRGGVEVCVCGKGFVVRFQEHVEQRCVCVCLREGSCGAVSGRGGAAVCVGGEG